MFDCGLKAGLVLKREMEDMLHISPTSPKASNCLHMQIALTNRFQLDIADAQTGLSTSDGKRIPHVSLGECGHLLDPANDIVIQASMVLAVHSADQAEEDRCLKRNR